MLYRTPSLKALRIFVAVARHGGVSRAAEALHLTHGAVSHQVRSLQAELGITLLEKNGRGIVLNAAAKTYAARLESAFQEIDQATQDVATQQRQRLRISTIPSFAACWLLPRLGHFVASAPRIDVEVQSTERLADLKGGEVDVALRFGGGRYPGLHSELLLRDWLFPVCTPAFAQRYRLADPPELAGVPLLTSVHEPWSGWLATAGVAASTVKQGLAFSDSGLMLQAALAGQGLALAGQSLVYDDLAKGRLVRPFAAFFESPNRHYFVCRKEKLESAPVSQFRAWLNKQLASYPTLA